MFSVGLLLDTGALTAPGNVPPLDQGQFEEIDYRLGITLVLENS